MKPVLVVLALAALAGCATQYPPNYYNARITDPNGWQTVSVTPVPYGTGARMAAAGDQGATEMAAPATAPATAATAPTYAPAPATTTVVTQPVYVAPPVYAASPVYVAPPPSPYSYWWPPISIGLGFSWSHWSGGGCCHGGWHGGGHGGGGGWRHR